MSGKPTCEELQNQIRELTERCKENELTISSLKERIEADQEKLHPREERYRALFENAPLPYQSLDDEGRFIDVNPAWLQKLGYSRDEVIGSHYRDYLYVDCQPHFEKNFPAFKLRGYVDDVQYSLRH
jgi:PAS domain-containing protein